jgi:hypothetical protein
MSDNVSYVGTIPVDSPGVGARVVQVGAQRRLYVTGVRGLTIYDVTDPSLPLPMGHLELPNWENEDVAVSADGNTVLISDFFGCCYMHVIDTSNPLIPRLVTTEVMQNFGHIVSCVDPKCDWVYGSEGSIYDLRNKANPTPLAMGWAQRLGLPGDGHNINIDAAGIATADVTPISMMDVSDPTNPVLIAQARRQDATSGKVAYQHNNLRPRADEWQPREPLPPNATDEEKAEYAKLRPGELILSNGETNATVNCGDDNGPFSSWKAVNWDKGQEMRLIEVFRPMSGTYQNGDPAVNAMGCSGHWFTENENYVAAAWYDHGTRILHVDPSNGDIKQVGFFQPVVGSASQALWIDDEYVYTVDYERGIDILRFDRDAPTPTQAEFDASWLSKLGVVSPATKAERYRCSYAFRQGFSVA